MSAITYGISANEIIAEPNFRARRDEQGKWRGSRSYIIRKEDKDSIIIQGRFGRGVAITTLGNDLNSYWNFLQVQAVEMEDIPGGFTRVLVDAEGYSNEGEWSFDSEKTYTLRAVLAEKPIIEHPNYLAEVRDAGLDSEHQAIVAVYNGTGFATDPTASNPQVRQVANQSVIITSMTDTTALKWWNKIFVDGVRTFLAPQYEWTVSESNRGGLTSNELAKFGRKETPDGSPPEPSGVVGWWHFVDATDDLGTNGSSNSRTWRFTEGTADIDIYDY